ncbi:MAG: proline--tRNA ligase [Deltaproteobacteria bacterium]|nr:proline--tRNA ligase [Deltaproteobacteria bacterium]
MRYSRMLIPTLKENPSEAEVVSHTLMMRAGLIRKLAAGIYDVLPLGLRSFRKFEAIVREEMNRAGAQEVVLPVIQPAELWQETGRWQKYGPELLRIKDRHGREFCFSPTAEEVITNVVRRDVRSYRQLPINLYQIHTKFRDEIRPRFGLMRGREFVMKDAYSFDADEPGADKSYDAMRKAYHRIFERCGLRFRAVAADSGQIGGAFSSEFMVLAATGESAVASCDACSYAANLEKASTRPPVGAEKPASPAALTRVDTPGARTIEEVTAFLGKTADQLLKTLIFVADGTPVAVLVRGDRELNYVKLQNLLGADELLMADPETTQRVTGAPVGFAGPIGLSIRVIADLEVEHMADFVVGANEADAHFTGCNIGRDFPAPAFADLRNVVDGDACPVCEGRLQLDRGIEVGHIFKLGTKYSESMHCVVLNDKGEEVPVVMGCYGIGIGRTVAASIEQNHDDAGIIWPMPLAPYHVALIAASPKDDVLAFAEKLHDDLEAAGVEVLYDDRDERAGVKFKDADLIGLPLRLTVGAKGLAEGFVELKRRAEPGAPFEPVPVADVVERVRSLVAGAMNV